MQEQKDQEGEKFDIEIDEGVKVVKGLTTKEIKALARPEFQKNPEKFYPTKIFEKYGFHRTFCPKCKNPYYRRTEKQTTCGDSNCVGSYTFIGKGTGIGRQGKKISYVDAWKSFEKSLTNAAVPCTAIDRYPVIARWRNDVDYTAAGIYCFQPYCVTGELDPPANPLICPQFCVRFNDLDNIGLTGRHYSGFVMIGMQVFNSKNKHVFWAEECVEFNYLWLTQELGVDPDEITFIEDVWAGGGNLGPSIEYFVGGLEVGNMVFMQFKTFPDGSREELDIKVIDVGIGMERVPWMINGTPTSYNDTYKVALDYLVQKLSVNLNTEVSFHKLFLLILKIWEKVGPLTCQLDVDEAQDIEETWKGIAKLINMDVLEVKKAIAPVRDLYIVLDHTRTIFMIISDGGLPSNVGGGCNARNILRRVFAIMKKNGWFQVLGMEGFLKLFEMHKKDLELLYGKFPEYKSFESIIQIEYDRWMNTDNEQKQKLEKYLKKKPKLEIDDWVIAVTSWGIPADVVAQISKQEIPDNLYYIIAERQELIHKIAPTALYNTNHLDETASIFYEKQKDNKFNAKIIEIFKNVENKSNLRNIVVLDQSLFYPTAGGQQNDTGELLIDNEVYQVINCEKAGKVVFHYLDRPLPNPENSYYIGKEIQGKIDLDRRLVLTRHHTATHVMFSACRKVLGPHIWQHGAKKTVDQAHLDVTHYKSVTFEQELEIENEANKIIMAGHPINKFFIDKAQAEKDYGFRLYQGGIVPGNQLRVVLIDETDVEACCGTHCSNTNEIGWIKLLKTQRIQDGIVRLYYVAGTKSIEKLNSETKVISEICSKWSIPKHQIIETAERFFKGYKKYSAEAQEKTEFILKLQLKYVLDSQNKFCLIKSDQSSPTLYFSGIPKYAQEIKDKQKGIIFIGSNFLYGLIYDPAAFNINEFKSIIPQDKQKVNDLKVNNVINYQNKATKKKEKIDKILQFNFVGNMQTDKIMEFLIKNQFLEISF